MALVDASSSYSIWFYLAIILFVLIVGLMVFFLKKLKYNFKQILRSVGVSLLISIVIQIIIFVVVRFLPQPTCGLGEDCLNNPGIVLSMLHVSIPVIFLIVIFLYYVVAMIRK